MKRNLWMRILTACLCAAMIIGSAAAENMIDLGGEGCDLLYYSSVLPDGRILLSGTQAVSDHEEENCARLLCLNEDRTVCWDYLDEAANNSMIRSTQILEDGTIGVWYWVLKEDTLVDQSLRFFTQDGKPTGKIINLMADHYTTILNSTKSRLLRSHEKEREDGTKEYWTELIDWDGKTIARFDCVRIPGYMLEVENGLILFGESWTKDYVVNGMTKMDLQGNILWEKELQNPWQDDHSIDIYYPVQAEDGGYLVVMSRCVSHDANGEAVFETALVKLDGEGNLLWSREVKDEYGQWCYNMTVCNGKTVMMYRKGYTINEPWRFHWFDENGKELGVTEMTQELKDYERLAEYTDKLKGEKDINPELLMLYPLPMKDGLWGMAFVGVRELVEGTVNDESMDEFLIKIPEP